MILICLVFYLYKYYSLDNKIKDEGIELLVNNISKMINLKIIQLNNNCITKQNSFKTKINNKCCNANLLIKI